MRILKPCVLGAVVLVSLACASAVNPLTAETPLIREAATPRAPGHGDLITTRNGSVFINNVVFDPADALARADYLVFDEDESITAAKYVSQIGDALDLQLGTVYVRARDEDELTGDKAYPIVRIDRVGAGAQGALDIEFVVVPVTAKNVAYVLLMSGDSGAQSWVTIRDDDGEITDEETLKIDEAGKRYIEVDLTPNASDPVLKKKFNSQGDPTSHDAKKRRDYLKNRRDKNKDKFWNPGPE